MKKVALTVSSFLLIVLVGLMIYFFIPKIEAPELVVSANNVELSVGEKIKFNYYISIKDANVDLKIDDIKIAKLEKAENGNFLSGISEGVTQLKIECKYGEETANKIIQVLVSEKSEDKSDVKIEDEKENKDEQQGDVLDDNLSEDENLDEGLEENSFKIKFLQLENCKFLNEKLILNLNQMAFFKVSSEINLTNLEIVSNSDKISVQLAPLLGNNTYMIQGAKAGDYSLTFKSGENVTTIFLQVV